MKRSFLLWTALTFIVVGLVILSSFPEGKHSAVGGGSPRGDYYVDINKGIDDAAQGASPERPWKTLHYAIDQINAKEPGTYLLHVASGEYGWANGEDSSRSIAITQSNLAIRGEGGRRPLIRGGGSWAVAFEVVKDTDNVTMDCLDIAGFESSAITVAGNHVSIQSCYIHNNSKGIHIVSAPNHEIDIVENDISDCDVGIWSGRSSKLVIERNRIHDNHTGILTYGGTIKNNLIYDNPSKGIDVGGKTSIYHNTLDGVGGEGDIGISISDERAICAIKYNIIAGFGVGIQREARAGNVILDYNDLWSNGANYEGVAPGPNDISEDPVYSDPENGDFRLKSGSPCIDAIPTTPDYPVDEDYEKNPRPQGAGYDIGAYEAPDSSLPMATPGCTITLSPQSEIVESDGFTGDIYVYALVSCGDWMAVSSDTTWITINSATSLLGVTAGAGRGNGTVNITIGANPTPCVTRFGQVSVDGTATTITQIGYSINPASASFTNVGGPGSVSVTASAGCNWTATSNDFWIHVTSGSSGTGNGTVGYSVDPNPSPARTGTMTIGDRTFTVDQLGGCVYGISPSNDSYTPSGGAGSVTVTTGSGCPWEAVSNVDWVTITSIDDESGAAVGRPLKKKKKTGPVVNAEPIPGIGNGTVNYDVDANTGPPRTGTMTIAGQTFTVLQEGCTYTITPTNASYSSAGGTGALSVTTACGCLWTATSSDETWLHVTSENSSGGCSEHTGGSGVVRKKRGIRKGPPGIGLTEILGPGTVSYFVDANTGPPRSGTIMVGGQTFSVSQEGAGCRCGLNPTYSSFTSLGGSGSVTVTAGEDCPPWTAASMASWIKITSGAGGAGNGVVKYSVEANNGPARTGMMIIAEQIVQIDQALGCTVAIDPGNASYGPAGGTGSVTVTAASDCPWTAANQVPWILVTLGISGKGNGTVNYSVAFNSGPPRTGTIIIGGQIFTVNQTSNCTYAINPTSASYPSSGGTGSATVTTDSNCFWTATSNALWITITSGASGTGNGTVNYSVAANPSAPRTGTITIGGQIFTVEQSSICSYTIDPTSASYLASGGTGSVAVTADGNCSWTATSNASWIAIASGESGSGNGSVGYSVSPNTGPARDGTMTIAGLTFNVHQEVITFTITVNITGSGTVRFVPPGPYAPGQKVVVYIEPAPGSGVLDVIVDGVSVGPVYTITFGDMSENHTIEVIFG